MERPALERLSKNELIELVLRVDGRCEELAARYVGLEQRNAELEARCSKLEAELAKARKNSSTSSKPPSSDIVKPPKQRRQKGKRKIGGQRGHPRHGRKPFPPEAVDETVDHKLETCPHCGGPVEQSEEPCRVVQQVELVEKPVVVTEHRAFGCRCTACGRAHQARLPAEVRAGGLFGPRLIVLVAYMKSVCHTSYSTIQRFLRAVAGVSVSRGYLANQIEKMSGALEAPYAELLERLPSEMRLNVDETGHKDNGGLFWTWCFRAGLFAVFRIDPSRGSQVLLEVLGQEFNGVLGCDYFSAYRKYMKDCDVLVQFCLAHLIRDVKYLLTVPDRATRNYAERVLGGLRRLFRVIHRREKMSEERFQKALERERRDLVRNAKRPPMGADAHNLAERFRKHGDAYFRFITTPGVEPTNNLAEQAIRFVVIDRRITQGTRGEIGQRWSERIWTTVATCAMQHRSVFDYLHRAIRAHFTGGPAPSLLLAESSQNP